MTMFPVALGEHRSWRTPRFIHILLYLSGIDFIQELFLLREAKRRPLIDGVPEPMIHARHMPTSGVGAFKKAEAEVAAWYQANRKSIQKRLRLRAEKEKLRRYRRTRRKKRQALAEARSIKRQLAKIRTGKDRPVAMCSVGLKSTTPTWC